MPFTIVSPMNVILSLCYFVTMGLYTTDDIRLSMSKEIKLYSGLIVRKSSKYAIEIEYNGKFARLTNSVLETIIEKTDYQSKHFLFSVSSRILKMLER